MCDVNTIEMDNEKGINQSVHIGGDVNAPVALVNQVSPPPKKRKKAMKHKIAIAGLIIALTVPFAVVLFQQYIQNRSQETEIVNGRNEELTIPKIDDGAIFQEQREEAVTRIAPTITEQRPAQMPNPPTPPSVIEVERKRIEAIGRSRGQMNSIWAWDRAKEQAVERLQLKLGSNTVSGMRYRIDNNRSYSNPRNPPDDGIYDATVVIYKYVEL